MEPVPSPSSAPSATALSPSSSLSSPAKRWTVAGPWNLGPRLLKPTDAPPAPIPPKAPGAVRFVCVSDTHNWHSKLEVPGGDVLLHAGDFGQTGEESESIEFSRWLSALPHPHKIVIAGNHDHSMDPESFGRHVNHQKVVQAAAEKRLQEEEEAAGAAKQDEGARRKRLRELEAEVFLNIE